MSQDIGNATRDLPIACKLPDEARMQRQTQVAGSVFGAARQTQELADGYAFQFTADASSVQLLTEFITAERECCPFFTFELIFEPNSGPLWLRLRGGEGVKEFIQAMIQ